MCDEIKGACGADPVAVARSTYGAQQSSADYSTTGAFDDYTFSLQFSNARRRNVHAFTVECGWAATDDPDDDDGGFWPNFTTQYPKVEREVHAALMGLLKSI